MKYLFDMGDVWHVYSDVENQWVYQRLERVAEEVLEKSAEDLPGPLGRLDSLKNLENECSLLKTKTESLEKEKQQALALAEHTMEQSKAELQQFRRESSEGQAKILADQRERFEQAYEELREMAEKLQAEGKLWRQRYLDLAYQLSPKGKQQ